MGRNVQEFRVNAQLLGGDPGWGASRELSVEYSAGGHLPLLAACDHEGGPACVLCALPPYVNKLARLRARGQDWLVPWTGFFSGLSDLPKLPVLYGEVFACVLVP